jgi:adenylylsulfate kinase
MSVGQAGYRRQSVATPTERTCVLQQTPRTLWLTGLSGAGKSTLANALEAALLRLGYACVVLDGDKLRCGLNRDLGFTPADRIENIRRIGEVARLMNAAGLIVIVAVISPYRADRAAVGEIIGIDRFREIHVSTPLEVCEGRDTKGFYRRARMGAISDFTGISAPYEAPLTPALTIDAASVPVVHALHMLLQQAGIDDALSQDFPDAQRAIPG